MKSATISVLLATVLGAGFLAGSCHSARERIYADAGDTGASNADHGRHVHAGASAAAAAGEAEVSISPAKQQLIGVRVSPVERRSATGRLRLYGRVAADETRIYTLNVGIDGFIREISKATTGSLVRKNEWLATFSAPEARLPIQGYLVALDVLDRTRQSGDSPAALEQAAAGVQQSIDRLLTLGMSSVQVEDIGRTRQVPPNIRITAPEEGFVVARDVSVGQKFERGEELYRIADLRQVWILADVFGRDAAHVRPGMVAEIRLTDGAGTLRGRVSGDVLPQFDQRSQSLQLRVEVDNPQYLLRPEMFVDVELPVEFASAIAISAEAILDSGSRKTVFVERTAGVFEPRPVVTGWRSGGFVEVLEGLSVGERIAVSGTFLIDSESRIRTIAPDLSARP